MDGNGGLYHFYNTCKNKYNKYILRDGGITLKKLIAKSKSADTRWEIPKGRLQKGENYLDCAEREIHEETNAKSSHYSIIGDKPLVAYTHTFGNTIFTAKYFVASLKGIIPDGVNMANTHQISELSDARWVSLTELRHMDIQHKNLYRIIKQSLQIFKKHNKDTKISINN